MAGFDDLLTLREQQYPGSPGTSNPVPAADVADPLDAELSTRESSQGRLRASVNQGIKTTPDKAATHQYLSRVTKMPLATVQSQEGEAQAIAKFQELHELSKTSPVLRERLLNPDFVAQVQDDVGPMDALVKALKYVSGSGDERSLLGDTAKAAGVVGLGATVGVGKMIFDTAAVPLDVLGGLTGHEGLKNAAAKYRDTAKRAGEAMDFASPEATTSTGKAVVSGLQSAGTNVALLPAGLAREFYTTAAQAATVVAGLIGTGVGAGAYSEAREKGKNQAQALTYAIPHGAFEFAFEKIPAAKLFRDLELDKSLAKVFARQVIPETVTEQLTTLSQDFSTWMNLNPDKTLKQFLDERPEAAYQTFVATLVGVGTQTTLIHGVNKAASIAGEEQQKQYTATAEFERMQELLKAAGASKLRERNPATFAEVAQELADKTEGAPKEVRFDAHTLDEVLNQEELAQLPSIQRQLEEARATGGEVSVPVGELLANIAGTPLEQKLMEHARIGDSEYSQAEVKKASETAADFLATESKRVIDQSTDSIAHQVSADNVKRIYLDQFNEIGRFTKDVNELNAVMVSNMYVALGARLGLTPEQAQAQHPLNITGVNPAKAGETLDQPDQAKQELVDQGVLKQVGTTMKGVKVYRATAKGEDSKGPRAAGSWVTPNRDIAVNVYAKGDESRVVEDYIPEKDLYEAHPDGWVYAPEGTDVTSVQRTADMTFGEMLNQGRGDVTTTPAFKKWFGDSKVVDADGKPLVVMHTSTYGDITEFKTEEQRFGKAGYGFYFSDAQGSNLFAEYGDKFQMERSAAGEQKAVKTYPVYLSLQNPLVIDHVDDLKPYLDAGQKFGVARGVFGNLSPDSITRLEKAGYDGIISRETTAPKVHKTQGLKILDRDDPKATSFPVYVAFDPKHIKSATGNNGNFDAKDASILRQGPSQGLSVEGYHFSKEARPNLDTGHYGTGLKGSGRETYQNASDKRLSKRLSFYVDKGTGVRPEAGVGGIAHKAQLSNIYDSNTDPLRLKRGSQTDFETRVLDAGYSGYLDRMEGTQPGQVILLGDQAVKPEVLGSTSKVEGARQVPPAGARAALGRDVVLDQVRADKSLPAGSAPLSRWRELLAKDPAVLDAFERAGVFDEVTREPDGSLRGLPRKVEGFKPSVFDDASRVASEYMAARGESYAPPSTYVKVDEARAKRVAAAFEEMKHEPQNKEVKAAYAAMIDETLAQYDAMLATGIKIEFVKDGVDPYKGNPRNMTEDVRKNNHMWVFSTREGFGTDATFDPKDNPLLAETKYDFAGQPALANDVFRAVHDYFGHVKEGLGFRADGEENAWRAHAAMFTPLARKALTTETRGQNSWLNYGPHGEKNRTAKVEGTHFADQKIGLLPQWAVDEGRLDPSRDVYKSELLKDYESKTAEPVYHQRGGGHVVNIGLGVNNDKNITPREVLAAIKALGISVVDSKVHQSNTEPTVVAKLDRALTPEEANALSVKLKQEAIAQVSNGQGELYGPGADNWKPFNPEYFLGLDGQPAEPTRSLLHQLSNTKWYSALEESVGGLPTKAAPAQGWVDAIKGLVNKGRVKQEEVEWTGITDWLKLQEGKVTKEQVQQFLTANGVEVTETVLGLVSAKHAAMRERMNDLDAPTPTHREMRAYDDAIREDSTKHAAWQLPGGKNYREVLLTLPEGLTPQQQHDARLADLEKRLRSSGITEAEHAERGRLIQGHPFDAKEPPSFKHSHWEGVPNVLAHFRVNDRTDADGKRVLFVEEVQSDWGQKGKRVGFRDESAVRAAQANKEAFRSEFEAADRRLTEAREETSKQSKIQLSEMGLESYAQIIGSGPRRDALTAEYRRRQSNPAWAAAITKVRDAEAEVSRLAAAMTAAEQGGNQGDKAPAAPFVGKTDAWVSLAMKRVIKMAVDEGYDKVAFINGEQSADRYELSSQVNSIEVIPRTDAATGEKTRAVWLDVKEGPKIKLGIDKDGIVDYSDVGWTGKPLADVIGKEMAKRVMEKDRGTLSGLDLKVGGGGMVAFYDKIVPSVAKDVLRKLGGGQMEAVKLPPISNAGYGIDTGPRGSRVTFPDGSKSEWLDSHEKARALLNETSSLTQPGFTITPAMREHAANGMALFQGSRGTFNPRTMTISLLENADLSTFHHEMGHFYLELLAGISSQPNAPASISSDMAKVLKWFGVSDLETWNAMPLEEKRQFHEKFAEHYEQYLFEGKSPSKDMHAMFQRFASWMRNVYRSLQDFMKSHNSNLTDEVRGVYDRMLATETQIEETEASRKLVPMFASADEAGMNSAEWAQYQLAAQDATENAIEQLQSRSLRDMKWAISARSKAVKAVTKDVEAKRRAVEAEVRAEVEIQPVYVAKSYLDSLKGDRNDADIQFMSEQLGFTSPDQMLRAIAEAEPIKFVIEGMTDQRLLERYGDLTTQKGIETAASEAVHNDARARFVATELRALEDGMRLKTGKAKPTTSPNVLIRAAKEFADYLIGSRKVRDLKPGKHAQAETRAAKLAAEMQKAGDTAGAIQAKRDQLLQFHAAKATLEAQADIEKKVKALKKIEESDKLPPEYKDQIDKLLERVELKERTLREIDKRAKLSDWLKAQEEIGVEPDIPDYVKEDAQLTNYKDMTVQEFQGLYDTIKQIEHLGRLKNKLLTAKDQREFALVRDDIAASINTLAGDRKANTRTPTSRSGRWLQAVKDFGSAHVKAATWARVMDGGQDGGKVWEHFIRVANEKGDWETSQRAEATQKLTDILAPWVKKGGLSKQTFFPSIDRSLSRQEVLAIALNTGNESNLQRLMGGEDWTLPQVEAVVKSLSPEEVSVVQAVWDHFETYRPQIGAKQMRVYGKEPEWIKPGSPVTELLRVRGGYYPVKYDTAASVRAEEHADAEGARQLLKGAYGTATTRRSFTKARAEEVVGRPLLYNLSGLYGGVNDVIHDLAWHEWLIDTNRLLKSTAIDGAMRSHYGPAAVRQFKTWRDAIAAGDVRTQEALDSALGYLRQSVSVAGLGFNVMSAMIQPLGFTQSISRIGARWAGKGLGVYLANPVAATRDAIERSEFMENRSRTQFRDLNELRNRVQGERGPLQAARESAYVMMQFMQRTVDVPTWHGAYEKAISEGGDEVRAVSLADQSVIDSQGSGLTKDLSAIERGGPAQRLFTVFYSFMNTVANMVYQSARSKGAGGKAADVMLLAVLPAVLGQLWRDALTPGDADDDDWKKMSRKMAGEQITYLMGLMVVTREFAEAGRTLTGASTYSRAYSGPAGVRMIADAAAAAKQVHQGEFDDAFRKAAVNLSGDVFGLPSAQINRSITGAKALNEGKTKNPMALLFGYQEPH